MAVYIYCRQSSGDQANSVSIDQQEQNCLSLAERSGLRVDKVFKDFNTSGRLYPKNYASLAELDITYKRWLNETKKVGQWRIALGELLNVLKQNDIILVDDKTRLARSLNGSYLENAIIQCLKDKNIKLISNKEGNIDFNSFSDHLVFSLQSSINSNQIEIQRKKAKDSIKRLIDSGELHQSIGMMLGYKFTGRRKEIEIDQDKAPIIKFIFKSFIEGNSIYGIVRDIDKVFGFKTCTKSIKNVIERPLYCGYMYDTNGNLVISKQTENKKIVDFNTWKVAKDILDSRKYNNIKVKKHFIHFTGMVKCAKCNGSLHVCINNQGKYLTFRCLSHSIRNKENCKISIASNTLYSKGLSLDEAVEPILILGLLKKLSLSNNEGEKANLETKRIELQNLLNNEKKLTEMFLGGLLDSSIYETNLKSQKEKKAILQQEIIEIENNLKDNDNEKLRKYINKILARKLTYAEYHELIPYTIKQILVGDEYVTIQTHEGDIKLKRYKEGGIVRLREYIWSNNPPNYKLYYYKEAPNIYLPKTVLFKNNNLTIYELEENQ